MNEAYRRKIIELVKNSQDAAYLKVVYTFALAADRSPKGKEAED